MALLRKSTLGKAPSKPEQKKPAGVFARARQVNENNQKNAEASRERLYAVKVPERGSLKVIVLDAGEPYAQYEHQYQENGRWGGFSRCIQETSSCPACAALDTKGTFVLRFTVLDRTEFTIKNGENAGKTVKISRKFLELKPSVSAAFERLYTKHATDERGLRGAVITLHRDGDKSPRGGNSFEFEKRYTDEELAALVAKLEPDTKKRADLLKVCDYEKAFPMPTEAELRAKFRVGSAPAGSEEFATEESFGEDDELPF